MTFEDSRQDAVGTPAALDSESDLEEEILESEVAEAPGDIADRVELVEKKIPQEIRDKFDVYSYRNAAVILSEARASEFQELIQALSDFKITKKMIRTAGKNESDIPKIFSAALRPLGWYETSVQGDLLVTLTSREKVGEFKRGKKKGQPKLGKKKKEFARQKYLDGHKIDYVKNKVAFDLEWNSKDQTFDRDLYAFSAFFQAGVLDAAVLVTRGKSLNQVFRALGEALTKDGETIEKDRNGNPRQTIQKYGASTTWMGKLLYRLNTGRNGGCPVLALGITPKCIEDWTEEDAKAAAELSAEPEPDSDDEED